MNLLNLSGELKMNVVTTKIETANGEVEGVCAKWSYFSILMITGTKGFIACPAIDVAACEGFGKACALVESSAENPIGTIERLCERKITAVNPEAAKLGLEVGMIAKDAFELIA